MEEAGILEARQWTPKEDGDTNQREPDTLSQGPDDEHLRV